MTELEYWDQAAQDPDVANKYIANGVSYEDCIGAIGLYLKVGSNLDIGCGIGRLSNAFAKANDSHHISGIDISQKMLNIAQKFNPEQRVVYKLTDGKSIPFEDNRFGCVYSMLTFQHCDQTTIKSYFKEAYRVLEKDGTFRFQYVRGNFHNFVDHCYQYNMMQKWLEEAGFKILNYQKGLIHPRWDWITATKI